MVFSSVLFLFRFLPLFLICYYVAPGRMKNVILLLGSLVFYAWGEPVYIFLMLFSTVLDYSMGRLIAANRKSGTARIFLAISVIASLLILCFFKYADFLVQTINSVSGLGLPLLNLPLPLGISFYTFQTMSYTIDVYRGEVREQKNILDFAVFVTMFPQLVAGPIVRYQQVEGSLHHRKPEIVQISKGAGRFVVGLAKKVLLANNMGGLWEMISAMEYGQISILTAWLGILAFAFQIYFDFSGYSDMAIGLGTMLGFTFPENFNYPYISASVTEFWRRWHISLGSWFREYVYIPLGGNRKGLGRQTGNILIVWALTGIWHGAGFHFLFWGLWFALFLILEKVFLGRLLGALPRLIGRCYTWFVVVLGWVFFALDSAGAIRGYLTAMFDIGGRALLDSRGLYLITEYALLFAVAALASTPLIKGLTDKLEGMKTGYGIAVYRLGEKIIPPALLLLSIAYMVEASYNPFLYFRF